MLTFFALGMPKTGGHKRAFIINGRPRIVESDRRVGTWRDTVAWAAWEARQRAGLRTIDAPVAVQVRFFLPRPSSIEKKRRWPWKWPDLDTLLRPVFDSITDAGVWVDDSRVVRLEAYKEFATDRLGCEVTIEILDEPPIPRARKSEPAQLELVEVKP